MTKRELVSELNQLFTDDEVVVCADIDGGWWDNIEYLGRFDGTATIYFGGGSPFSDEK